jgi:hypothetical protein
MCDYSLQHLPNRLAIEGERLVVTRFSSGSIGLAPAQKPPEPEMGFWKRLLQALTPAESASCAVCVPPGARLRFVNIRKRLQRDAKVGTESEVIFTQLTAEENAYRDAIRFPSGMTLLLQYIEPGQIVDVLSLSSDGDEPDVQWTGLRLAA